MSKKVLLKNNDDGTILIMTMIILTSILVIVLTASEIVRTGLIINRIQFNSTKAYFAAESGIERVLEKAWKEDNEPTSCVSNTNISFDDEGDCGADPVCCVADKVFTLPTNNAGYRILFNKADCGNGSGYNYTFTSTGSYSGVHRVVEASYCIPDCTAGGLGCGQTSCCDTICPPVCNITPNDPGCLASAPSNNSQPVAGSTCCGSETCYECTGGACWDGNDCSMPTCPSGSTDPGCQNASFAPTNNWNITGDSCCDDASGNHQDCYECLPGYIWNGNDCS